MAGKEQGSWVNCIAVEHDILAVPTSLGRVLSHRGSGMFSIE